MRRSEELRQAGETLGQKGEIEAAATLHLASVLASIYALLEERLPKPVVDYSIPAVNALRAASFGNPKG